MTTATAYRVLVFSRTTGYRHDSIPAGVTAIRDLGTLHGFAVDATEDPAVFTVDNLARYATVVFLNTSGDVFEDLQRAAFTTYIRSGGGFLGVHLAAGTEYDWAFYGELVGAFFADHPEIQPATVRLAKADHPLTAGLPESWEWLDEWYNFQDTPPDGVRVLLRVDESTYEGGTMGADHPVAWCHEYQGGRSCYVSLGHRAEAYGEPVLRDLLLAGIRYAAGRALTPGRG